MYVVSQRIVLNRDQVREALAAAAMARAAELSQFGSLKVSSLSLDTRLLDNGGLDIVGAVAVVETAADGIPLAAMVPRSESAIAGAQGPGAEAAGRSAR
jgi:hypothetical protein